MRRIFISFFLSILLLKYASSQDGSPCQTKASLDSEAGETCAQLEASEDHYCTANTETGEGQKPCIEADACNSLSPDEKVENGDKCAQHPVHKAGNICKTIKDNNENDICKEFTKCEGATPDPISYNNCKDLWTDASSKKCVVNDNEDACKEATNCGEVIKGADDTVCGLFTTASQICVLNGVGCKVAENCADVKNGANTNACGLFTTTDLKCVVDGAKCTPKTICGKEAYAKGTTNCRDSVTNNDNEVCVDTGSKCEPQTPCEQVAYSASIDCTKLPTVDPSKICEKHKTENRCAEVTKPDNAEGTETKSSEGTETKSSEGTETKSSGETGPTQGAETDLSKDNKGMLLNLSLYTLLIYFLF